MFERICTITNLAEAGRIVSLLKAEGLHPVELNASAHVTVAGADQAYFVEVPKAEAEAARGVLGKQGFASRLL